MAERRKGRPSKIIDEKQVAGLKRIGLKRRQIAELIGVAESTLRERRKHFDETLPTHAFCTWLNRFSKEIGAIIKKIE